jgi:hypothetical protein
LFTLHNQFLESVELTNEYLEVFWDLPAIESSHGELGLITNGDQLFHNTLSVEHNDVEVYGLIWVSRLRIISSSLGKPIPYYCEINIT